MKPSTPSGAAGRSFRPAGARQASMGPERSAWPTSTRTGQTCARSASGRPWMSETRDLASGTAADANAWPRPASLIGRESELGMLESAAATSRTAAQFAAVMGEPGVGKTHLLSVLHDELGAAGWRMLSGRAAGPGARLPFGLLVDALDGVLGEVINRTPDVPDGPTG